MAVKTILRSLTPRLRAAARNEGTAAVEFALILPLFVVMLFAILQFGLTFNNYIELTDAVREGAQVLAQSRTSTTPYTSATSAITNAAPALSLTASNYTLTVNGAACASNSCMSSVTGGTGENAVVTATYPCNLNLIFFNPAPSCTLTATSTDEIE